MFGKLQQVDIPPKHLKDYEQFIPEIVNNVHKEASKLQGLKVAHLSATSLGGGVSEILHSMVPLQNDIGLVSKWYVLPQNEAFFAVTKKIHNLMQGKKGALTDEEEKLYLSFNEHISNDVLDIDADILIVHDPQPAAVISYLHEKPHKFKQILWRCHIDTSSPNQLVWDFLKPFLTSYDKLIFSMEDFANDAFPKDTISLITPGIDPLTEKNIPMHTDEAKEYVTRFGIRINDPLLVQVSRFDPWKDPLGVIEVYRRLKAEFPNLQLALIGQIAGDDPEGKVVLQKMEEETSEDHDIFMFTEADVTVVNAFQTMATIVLQKSLREGFGLTVTEAMWKKKVVVGGNVGGIALQITDGENGFLIDSIEEAVEKTKKILRKPMDAEQLGENAHNSVRREHLTPHKLLDYLRLFSTFDLHSQ